MNISIRIDIFFISQNTFATSLFSSTADIRLKYKPSDTSVSVAPVERKRNCRWTVERIYLSFISLDLFRFRVDFSDEINCNEKSKWIKNENILFDVSSYMFYVRMWNVKNDSAICQVKLFYEKEKNMIEYK